MLRKKNIWNNLLPPNKLFLLESLFVNGCNTCVNHTQNHKMPRDQWLCILLFFVNRKENFLRSPPVTGILQHFASPWKFGRCEMLTNAWHRSSLSPKTFSQIDATIMFLSPLSQLHSSYIFFSQEKWKVILCRNMQTTLSSTHHQVTTTLLRGKVQKWGSFNLFEN